MSKLYGIIINHKYLISNENFETEHNVMDMNNFNVNLCSSGERSIASFSNTSCNYVEIPKNIFVSLFGREPDFGNIPSMVYCINFDS